MSFIAQDFGKLNIITMNLFSTYYDLAKTASLSYF